MEDLWLDCFQWLFGDVLNLPTMTDGLNIAAVHRSKPEGRKRRALLNAWIRFSLKAACVQRLRIAFQKCDIVSFTVSGRLATNNFAIEIIATLIIWCTKRTTKELWVPSGLRWYLFYDAFALWAHWYSRYEIKIFKEFGVSDNLTAFSAFTINVIGAEKDYLL